MRALIILFIILKSSLTLATTKEEQKTWVGLFAKKNLWSHYDLWAEAQLRHDESQSTMQQTLNRFGVLKKISEHHEIGALFAFVQGGGLKEYRLAFQHVLKKHDYSIRSRIEVRDIEDNDANSLRFRTQFRYAKPLSSKYDVVLWDEPFFNLTHEKWAGNKFIERNRAFLGTRIKFDQISFEVGYMNQYVPRDTTDTSEHILTLYSYF